MNQKAIWALNQFRKSNLSKTLIQSRHGGFARTLREFSDKSKGGSRFPVDSGEPRPFAELHFFSSGRNYDSYPLNSAVKREPASFTSSVDPTGPLKPQQILEYLNAHVIGQEHAKKVMAVSVYNHYCRVKAVKEARHEAHRRAQLQHLTQPHLQAATSKAPSLHEQVPSAASLVIPEKSNLLLIGPSGSGKTLLAKTVSRLLRVPFAMGDATGLTEAGYVGEDVDSILYRLLETADFNLERAQAGIIFLDEVDKIAKTPSGPKGSPSSGGGRDVGGEGVQHALLKMLEGTVVQVADRRRAGGRDYIPMDTSNLLFVLSGAFVGLEGIVAGRLKKSAFSLIGFSETVDVTDGKDQNPATSSAICGNWMNDLQTEDVISYGLIPEFVGRVPVLAVLEELDESALVRTLTEPKNSLIKQYQHLFAMHGIILSFTPAALKGIGASAVRAKTGARGLRGILEKLLLPMMFEMPGRVDVKEICIDEDYVRGDRKEPLITAK